MDAHRSDAMNGDAIDRELQDLLAIEPSPAFAGRVRARIAGEQTRASWLTWRRVAFVSAGIAVLAVAAVVTMRAPESGRSAIAHSPTTTPTNTAPVVARHDGSPSVPLDASRVDASNRRPLAHSGNAIAPRAEVRGMQRLLTMAAQQDATLAAMFDVPVHSAESPLSEPTPIVIEPLTIAPLATDSY